MDPLGIGRGCDGLGPMPLVGPKIFCKMLTSALEALVKETKYSIRTMKLV